ncbi:MAG: MJ1477/TM1410 family putative glycoside hydrolase [Candidatus Odinarchaeota archaeon]
MNARIFACSGLVFFMILNFCVPASTFPQITWKNVQYWGYQLQDVNLENLAISPFDLYVIDYSSDGSNDTAWTASEMVAVKNKNKLLLSYISIGEAEDYRYYWDDSWESAPPEWLDSENPDWEGNYKVKFWMDEWQDIVYSYLDIILAQGFNGVYLDIIDAYEYYQDKGIANADGLMMDFVRNISIYTRARAGQDFGIFPQNGDELLKNATYRSFITGIGIEDLYFFDDGEENNPVEVTRRETNLDLLIADGGLVLTVDYVQTSENRNQVYALARSKGYVPYCTTRDLNALPYPLLIGETFTDNNDLDGTFYSTTGVLVGLTVSVIVTVIRRSRKRS